MRCRSGRGNGAVRPQPLRPHPIMKAGGWRAFPVFAIFPGVTQTSMLDASVTQLLARLRDGDTEALDRLLPLVYEELRLLARAQLRREEAGHTLGSTALVHEAYIRLAQREKLSAADRRHFFVIATQAMRRILIDHARTRKRKKRGSGQVLRPLDDISAFLGADAADELTAIDDALERLAGASPRAARVVECLFFAGLTLQETADILDVSMKTVQRDWTLARAWLRKEIEQAARSDLTSPALESVLDSR
jgi:RNA polymerase sigma-70 factor, ECF subfamily